MIYELKGLWPRLFFVTAIAALSFPQLISCGGGGGGGSDPDESTIVNSNRPFPVPTTLDCSAGSNLSYENFGSQFLRRYCSGCHSVNLSGAGRSGAPDTINLDSASDAIALRVDMIRSAGPDDAKMPPGVNVLKDERALFREWLACGAP